MTTTPRASARSWMPCALRCSLALALFARLAAADPATTARRAFLESLNGSNPIPQRYECVTVRGIRVDRITSGGGNVTVELTVDAVAELPITRAPREYPPHWIVRLQRGRVRGIDVPEAAFARELAAMSDPLQRLRALSERSELVDAELVRQLCDVALETLFRSRYTDE